MKKQGVLEEAGALLERAVIRYRGRAVGTSAVLPGGDVAAENYRDCFVRDFVPVALVFLLRGESEIVRGFLETLVVLQKERHAAAGHRRVPGLMPASFRVATEEDGRESLHADFGDKAIGRVTPVDSMLWWLILLDLYQRLSGDTALARTADFQQAICRILDMGLSEALEDMPTLLVPDGAFMIDRRLGVYGHPLEIQVLLHGALEAARRVLAPGDLHQHLKAAALARERSLCAYLRMYYWLDLERLNEILRFGTEEFGGNVANLFNIYPEAIPDWLLDWLPERAGYLVGNLGPGRMDFRFFAQGNLLAVLFGVARDDQAAALFRLYESRWHDLVGAMPAKLVYPALTGEAWQLLTGCDPKNVPWSYHNGGNWPVLLYSFVAAALSTGRADLAERAFEATVARLGREGWPEYYDGRGGRLIGRRANLNQIWSAASLLLAARFLDQPAFSRIFAAEFCSETTP